VLRCLGVALATWLSCAALMAAPSGAGAAVLAVEPQLAAAPALWEGGAAWWDSAGIRAAAPGSGARLLLALGALGFSPRRTLDSGSGSGTRLAWGWQEINEAIPPMGPGDQNVSPTPIPPQSSVTRRGVVAPGAPAERLPGCGDPLSSPAVSLGGARLAYLCADAAAGAAPLSEALTVSPPGGGAQPLAIADASAPFQLSGGYVAYAAGPPLTGTPRIVVRDLATETVAYETPPLPEWPASIALQPDGTLVVVGQPSETCAGTAGSAEWFSPASPAAHALGCLYGQALRPAGGRIVALAPAPGGQAALELIQLATGQARLLELFASPGAASGFAADFDGTRLTWLQDGCAGTDVEYAGSVEGLAATAPAALRCPLRFHVRGPLRPGPGGRLRLAVSCPSGCQVSFFGISRPAALADAEENVLGPTIAAGRGAVLSFRLDSSQLAYLRRRHTVKVTVSADTYRLDHALSTWSAPARLRG